MGAKITSSVLFDDTLYYIEIGDIDYQCLHQYEFYDCVKIILSKKQYEKFVGDYTKREFKVADGSISRFKEYLENNYWRRNH